MAKTPKGFLLYKIYYDDALVYLGRTKQPLSSRLRGHFFQKPMHRVIDINHVSKIEYASFPTEADMNLYEIYYILTLHPTFNVDDKTRDYPTVSLPDVKWKNFWPPKMEEWKEAVNKSEETYTQKKKRNMAIHEELRVLRSMHKLGEIAEDEFRDKYDALDEEQKQIKSEIYGTR